MGGFVSHLLNGFSTWFNDDPSRVILIGLDAAGKTTLLYKCKLNETVTTIPTIGFNVETVTPVPGLTLTVWDLGGQEKIRTLWRYYVQDVHGIIWMVDSNDADRFGESREELMKMLQFDELKHQPILLFANKQDLPNAEKVGYVVEKIGLNMLRGRKWHAQAANCLTGDGIYEGFEKLADMIKDFKRQQQYRQK